MKKLACGFAMVGVVFALPAHALEVTETVVSKYVDMKLPKSVAGVQLMAPKVTLLDGHAMFCAIARPKLFPKDVEFCSNLTPQWRHKTASLLGTNMSLTSLNAPGLTEKHLETIKKLVNATVLPALEGIEIYKADNFIGRQVSTIKIKPGKLDLSF